MTWRAIKAFLRFAPRESAVFRLTSPASMRWTDTDHLLAVAVDLLQAMVWQRSKPGTARPKPIPRPGAAPAADERRLGKARMEMDEGIRWAEARRNGVTPLRVREEVS